MRARWISTIACSAIALVASLAEAAALPLPTQTDISGLGSSRPEVRRPEAFAISLPLRELAETPSQISMSHPPPRAVGYGERVASGPVVDTVQQSGQVPSANYTVGQSFLGLGNGFPNYTVLSYHPIPSIVG